MSPQKSDEKKLKVALNKGMKIRFSRANQLMDGAIRPGKPGLMICVELMKSPWAAGANSASPSARTSRIPRMRLVVFMIMPSFIVCYILPAAIAACSLSLTRASPSTRITAHRSGVFALPVTAILIAPLTSPTWPFQASGAAL